MGAEEGGVRRRWFWLSGLFHCGIRCVKCLSCCQQSQRCSEHHCPLRPCNDRYAAVLPTLARSFYNDKKMKL